MQQKLFMLKQSIRRLFTPIFQEQERESTSLMTSGEMTETTEQNMI